MGSAQRKSQASTLSRGTGWAAIVITALLGWAGSAGAAWTIIGTAVTEDSWTGVPDVRVTIFPESISVTTDTQGDFFLPWKGTKGWITFVPPQNRNEGWCKSYTLFPRRTTKADSTLDIGRIFIVTKRLPLSPPPTRPAGVEIPAVLHVSGPKAGQSDSLWVRMRYHTDLWGKAGRCEVMNPDNAEAPQVIDALTKWIRSVTWKVDLEARCGEAEPISGIQPFGYVWQDTAWVYTPNIRATPWGRPGSSLPQRAMETVNPMSNRGPGGK
jgi:hypothetical protein